MSAAAEPGAAGGYGLALFTDLYELAMYQAYLEEGLNADATFELFMRALPDERNFLLAAGLDDALAYLEGLRFEPSDLAYLDSLGKFSAACLESLAGLRFDGEVRAVPEGTAVFAGEPLLEVHAPLPVAQLAETYLLNQLTFQTMLASTGARAVEAAAGRELVDFGARRAHGTDAANKAARAFYLAGFGATSNLEAGRRYGIPVAGTMAHSYVLAHEDDAAAFRAFARTFPRTVLLVDTYDTLDGVREVVALAEELGDAFEVQAIRLDSGDLGELARESRRLLDAAGLQRVRIVASGGLDAARVAALVASGAPIDSFGVGTSIVTSADAPSLESVYKLVEYDGVGRAKFSPGKATLPGRKQVYRRFEDGVASRDVIARLDEPVEGEPLLVEVMRGGRRLDAGRASLEESRALAARSLEALPSRLRSLEPAEPYSVELSEGLRAAAERRGPS